MKNNKITFLTTNPNADRGLTMKFTKEERLEIGRRIYNGELSRYEASEKYGICIDTARNYMRLYRDTCGLPSRRGCPKKQASITRRAITISTGLTKFEAMSKDELIHEIIMSRIREERLKKDYKAKGGGMEIPSEKKIMKSL